MGHIRLGILPQTRKWREVIDLLGIPSSPAQIADATSAAAEKGIEFAKYDTGVSNVVYLFIRAIWDAKQANFTDDVTIADRAGAEGSTLTDFVANFNNALEEKLAKLGKISDLAEMARYSGVETLTELCKQETKSLFGVSSNDAKQSLGKWATPQKFGYVGQTFFAKFLYRFLDYHLSREIPSHIGPDKSFSNISKCAEFKKALELHCYQTARIAKECSGCWPNAAQFREGITIENVKTQFLPCALARISDELRLRRNAK
ncbi:MAG: hypothetical protein A2Y13_12405 [Planctomycetes bacterium GWC2_45_44]|nr:MAG: hypothetical protein A2Y13_12405 [Planctomycetes bacterium GWC2_45_44]HBR18739.1 hypothetical protein [Phycisphaerales bacterium]